MDKIEKTFQTILPSDMILQHQYRAKNYQNYSNLIHDILQAEKHDELESPLMSPRGGGE
jgi:hypothetical protein